MRLIKNSERYPISYLTISFNLHSKTICIAELCIRFSVCEILPSGMTIVSVEEYISW